MSLSHLNPLEAYINPFRVLWLYFINLALFGNFFLKQLWDIVLKELLRLQI